MTYMSVKDFNKCFKNTHYDMLNNNYPIIDILIKLIDLEGHSRDRLIENRAKRLYTVNFRRFIMISVLRFIVNNYKFLLDIINNYGNYDDILDIVKWNSIVKHNITEMYNSYKEFYYTTFYSMTNSMAIIEASIKAEKIVTLFDTNKPISNSNKFTIIVIDDLFQLKPGINIEFINNVIASPDKYEMYNYDISKIEEHAYYLYKEHNIDI